MGRLRSVTRSLIAVAPHQVLENTELSYLQQNMLFLVKLNPEFTS